MPRVFIRCFQLVTLSVVATVAGATMLSAASSAGQEPTAAEVMQSVFANRVRDGGFWRQDNEDFEEGADVPEYWMQVWRNGPGDEVVIFDAYAVMADNTCSALIHVVLTYDPESGRIRSDGYGANGMSAHGVMEFEGTVTSGEMTLQLPGGREMRMRDREDQGAPDRIVVEAETWDGEGWTRGEPATWHRSANGPPCSGEAPS